MPAFAPSKIQGGQELSDLLAAPIFGAWRAALPAAQTAEPAAPDPSVRGALCTPERWRGLTAEHDPQRLARTVFAAVLAIDSGAMDIGLAVGNDARDPQIETLRVDLDVPLTALLQQWEPWQPTTDPRDTGARRLRRLVESANLPSFHLGHAGDNGVSPLRCVTEGPQWTLAARIDVTTAAALTGLLEQISAALRILTDNPAATVRHLATDIQPLTYDITVLGDPGFTSGGSALSAWGRAIGLEVAVHRIEPEQIHGEPTGTLGLAPQPCGANLVVVGPGIAALPCLESPNPELAGTLPDGRPIAQLNPNETRELYDEIVVRNRYLRYGIQIGDGDLVVDVGANIGLFTLFAAGHAANVRVEAFEPAPESARRLRANMTAYGIHGAAHTVALGACQQTRTLVFYPRSSLQSGFHTDTEADRSIVRGYARQQARRHTGQNDWLADEISAALDTTIADRTAQRRNVEVPVISLSSWIRLQKVTAISLLKIDVERAEEEVLAGIDQQHWAIIAQLVIEVHDVGDRLARVLVLLEQRGFATAVEQDELFAGSEIVMVYARRPGALARPPSWLHKQIALAVRWERTSGLPVYVTVPPNSDGVADTHRIRQAVAAAGLPWIEPPGESVAAVAPLAWAETVLRRLTANQRPVLKAIVADADNTLWEGVCGEVGSSNVTVAGPYLEIQQLLAEQLRAGRQLCLCTRNNVEDIAAVFASHPDMPLRLDDFTVVHAGWGAKSPGVAAIADQLGFAVESLAYLDDSPMERAEVALAHPGMTVVDLPADAASFPAALRATWQLALDLPATGEDQARIQMIAEETQRRAATAGAASMADFLQQLDLDVQVTLATVSDAERISQLAARTTQLNVLLRNHTPASVTRMISSGILSLAVRVRDRFGDYGLVGFAAAEYDGDTMCVRDFFLSCRALGRNVEWRMLKALGEHAVNRGLRHLDLLYTPGPRNRPAMQFTAAARVQHPGLDGTQLLDAWSVAQLPWRSIGRLHDRAKPRRSVAAASATTAPNAWLRQPSWPVSPQPANDAERVFGRCSATLTSSYVPAETPLEKQINRVWEQVLGISPIGIHDDLFALGCDSITAALICTVMRQDGLQMSFPELLAHPTVRRVADLLQRTARDQASSVIDGQADEPVGPASASLGQQRIWAAEMIGGRGNAQIIPVAHRITGPLDIDLLRAAFTDVIQRHPALRTVLREHDGGLVQQAIEPEPTSLAVVDLSGLPEPGRPSAAAAAADHFLDEPFDLGRDVMLRARLLRWSADDHTLLTVVHHSAADGWSVDLIHRDLSRAYAGSQEPVADHHAAPFITYSHRIEQRRRAGLFTQSVTDARAAVPADAAGWSRSSALPTAARHRRSELGHVLTAAAASTARSRGTTPFTIHLAAYQLVLATLTGATAIVTGCPVAHRDDPDVTNTVGFLANIVPITGRFNWTGRLGDHLEQAVSRTTAALQYSAVPYGLLTEHGGPALFDTLFTLQPEPPHPLHLHGCAVTPSEPARWPQPYPLMLDVQDGADGASLLLRFDSHAIHPAPPPRIVTAYPLVLAALCALPDLQMNRLRDLLSSSTGAADLIRERLVHACTGKGA